MNTIAYEVDGRIARITLDRPERGNGITLETPRELVECVERANLDPAVHVIALAGNGKGFCWGYDLGRLRRARSSLRPVSPSRAPRSTRRPSPATTIRGGSGTPSWIGR
jgi:enoyl-CoA hydratase/carnithine racemase